MPNITATRQVQDLLALAQQDLVQAEQRWNVLANTEQLDLLNNAGAEQRCELLLLSEDATTLVQQLPTPLLLPSLQATDEHGSVSLLGCVNGEQLNQLLDLDCLHGEERRVRRWLAMLCDISESALEAIIADRCRFADRKS